MEELTVTYTPAKLAVDFAALRKAVEETVAPYAGLVVTEDDIPGAKRDRAALRAYKDQIETERKRVKNEYLKPYAAFEAECKSITSIIDEAVSGIDEQIKEFEARDRAEKIDAIRQIYTEEAPEDVREFLPFEAVFVEAWANKSTTEKAIREAIQTAVGKVKAELDYFRDKGPEVRAYYKRTRNLIDTMRYADELAAERKAETVEDRVEEIRKAIPDPIVIYTARIVCTAEALESIKKHAANIGAEIDITDQISEEDF